jgi:lysophospholipase L1-like esterase
MRYALLVIAVAPLAAQNLKFDFSSDKAAPGFEKVLPGTLYSEQTGYGFEEPARQAPFYFSVRVPEEGNYRVTVTLGDPANDSVTTIKAELRRLMLERVRVSAGKTETRSFLVNVRTPKIPGGGEVHLKDREKTFEARAWDDRLTLEFTDTHPAVRTVVIAKADGVPTIYIAGDSTSTDQPREPFNSWGQMLPRFFKPEIAIANHGESGESLRGFLNENRWAKLLSAIKPGDTVLIQMGHNDQKEKGEGIGAFTSYKTDLKRFVADARQHGATPVLVTPMHRLTFDAAGKITNSLGDYPEAVRQTAKEENVALIDLNAMSKLSCFMRPSARLMRTSLSRERTPLITTTTAATSWPNASWKVSARPNCRSRNTFPRCRPSTRPIPIRWVSSMSPPNPRSMRSGPMANSDQSIAP